jgi:hypothetical protein
MRYFVSVEIILTFLICLILPLEVIAQQIKDISSGKTSVSYPPIVIYKMKRDYSRNVPVLLSDDKSEIVSYPHPMDLIGMTSKEVMPIRLHGGYFLDRRGINKNVAFLNISYNNYRKLRRPLSISEIEKLLLDRNPLTDFLSCPDITYSRKIVQDINLLIDKGELKSICR